MERVSARPKSFQCLRQRVLPQLDMGFKPMVGRQGQTKQKLAYVSAQLARISLAEIDDEMQMGSHANPHHTAVNMDQRAPSTRYMSAPSARFTYDGFDLTGVIQSRVLDQHSNSMPVKPKRDHNLSLALHKHIQQLKDRKAKSASPMTLLDTLNALGERKSCRERRDRPWSEQPLRQERARKPVPSYLYKSDVDSEALRRMKHMESIKAIEEKWQSERDDEMWTIERCQDYKPISIVMISSHLKLCDGMDVMSLVREDPSIVPIVYDYSENISYRELVETIQSALENLRDGLKAEKIVFICQGGPGYAFLLPKQIITGAKIKKDHDLKWFWGETGKLMSKRDPSQTAIVFAGCASLEGVAGKQISRQIKAAAQPNRVNVFSLPANPHDASDFEMAQKLFTNVHDFYETVYGDHVL